MKRLLHLFRTCCRATTFRTAHQPDLERRARIEDAVEHVVDGTEPRLRLVPRYRKKLHQVAAISLDYVNDLVEKIPGTLDVNPAAFVRDPQVNAFFATPEDLRCVFSRSPELQAFFDDINHSDLDQGYALLCTTEHEKILLGTELAGDMLRRDAMQTAVYFSAHKVMSPAASETDVRRGLKQCIFDALITHALRHIANLKSQRRGLEDQRRMLLTRLRARQAQGNGLTKLLATAYPENAPGEDIERQLAETEKKLGKMPVSLDVLGSYLDEIKKILAEPECFIRLRWMSFNLTGMGIKVNNGSSQTAHAVQFAEIEIANVLKHVVAIVRYPRTEMRAPQTALI